MKVIDEWRQGWRFWSVRLNALGAALLAAMMTWPEPLLGLWAALPRELTAILPPRAALAIPLALNLAATAARLIKQRRLYERKP